MATTDALQEGMVAPAGVTASAPDEPTRISPAHQTPPPIRSQPSKLPPNAPPRLRRLPRRLTTRTTTRPRRPERSATRREQQHQCRAEGNHLHRRRARSRASGTVAVADRTWRRGIPGHPWPGQARNGPLSPAGRAAASWHRCRQPPSRNTAPLHPGSHAANQPRRRPAQARWAP